MHLSAFSQLFAILALSATVLSAPLPASSISTAGGHPGGPRAAAACPARKLHTRATPSGSDWGYEAVQSGENQLDARPPASEGETQSPTGVRQKDFRHGRRRPGHGGWRQKKDNNENDKRIRKMLEGNITKQRKKAEETEKMQRLESHRLKKFHKEMDRMSPDNDI
ncbi:hypothetical protein MCOR25_008940 [Pyricularia grisea]|uniref:Uncharacterized protein n=1 Tax=Pyricularia grisea TaxID=148305 RepID=A0A6P8AQF9_PYRGI|nr:uncharacterized protein PgNI_12077 [Pyricularia grisea]KAI6353558.1 hypothetical protein MCOR25_008940 [Pyricularia grisea]TLD04291.1 hypothetical protein PgNI_12077 [Pyricularia grisea]